MGKKGKVVARVSDIRGLKKGAKKRREQWIEDICCLRCGRVLE